MGNSLLTRAHPLPATDEMVRSWVPVPGSEGDARDTLDRIENLSDEEADHLLAAQLRSEG